eukprot:5760286-Lingulodinium_polyedra.AAC.1
MSGNATLSPRCYGRLCAESSGNSEASCHCLWRTCRWSGAPRYMSVTRRTPAGRRPGPNQRQVA